MYELTPTPNFYQPKSTVIVFVYRDNGLYYPIGNPSLSFTRQQCETLAKAANYTAQFKGL